MNVVTTYCSPDNLQQMIQDFKDAGKRILAVSPSKMKKENARSQNYEVIEFVVVAQ
jgi:hypothetical protein